jgi:HK97 family phage major capsid protein
MVTAGGNNVLTLGGGVGPSFAGYPAHVSQVLLSDATADYNGKVMVLFGSLSASSIFGDRHGLEAMFDVSRYVEYRQIYAQVTERLDIVVHDIGTATACGPIAGLKGTT